MSKWHGWQVLLCEQCADPAIAAAAQRFLLWERRNNTVMPFNETVQQVFARISALRDSLDGPQVRHARATCDELKGLGHCLQGQPP